MSPTSSQANTCTHTRWDDGTCQWTHVLHVCSTSAIISNMGQYIQRRGPFVKYSRWCFSVQSVHFWAGVINQRQWLKVELRLAEKPLILTGKALTVWQFRSLCSACIPVVCNTIVLMKDSATVLQGCVCVCVCDCIICAAYSSVKYCWILSDIQ